MTEELKEMADVLVVMRDEVVVPVMVKLGVMVTDPWPVLYPLFVRVVMPKDPPPPPDCCEFKLEEPPPPE
jgi:hypothetical protein